jgi:hypothetical protein
MYGGKPNLDKKKPKDKDKQSKDKDKDKPRREPKMCKGCKNPRALHTTDECFKTHKDLRKKWEERWGKKFITYKERQAKKNNKSKESYNTLDNDKEDS